MKRVLIIEDEQPLRRAIEQGLAALPEVEVQGCDSVATALESLIRFTPACLVLGLNLPGDSAIDLLEDLACHEPLPKVVVTTPFGAEQRVALARFPEVEVLDKPVPIEFLRERIRARLSLANPGTDEPPVFAIGDYLQLAAMNHASTLIEAELRDGREGRIEVWRGEIWCAHCPPLRGIAAVEALLFTDLRRLRVEPLQLAHGEREVFEETSRLLLEAACARDESRLLEGVDGEVVRPDQESESDFRELFRAAVAAYLERRYQVALELFERCLELRPGESRARHNLCQLKKTMGVV